MVLKLSGESPKNTGASETEKSFFTKIFLKTLIGNHFTPLVLESEINQNSISLTVEKIDTINNKGFDKAPWVNFSFSGRSRKSPTLKFSLDNKNTYDFEFKAGKDFHRTMDLLFRRKPKHTDDKTIDSVGLSIPARLDTCLHYESPIAFWRGFPKEFLESIAEIDFTGRFYRIVWPKNGELLKQDSYRNPNNNELIAHVLDRIEHNQRAPEFQRLKEMLTRTGFIEYQLKESRPGIKKEHFIINPENINYHNLQILEEITREEPEEVKQSSCHLDQSSRVIIKGQIDRDAFSKVHDCFDHFMAFNMSEVQAGNLIIRYNFRDRECPVTIYLKESTIEDAERLKNMGIAGENVIIRPKHTKNNYKNEVIFEKDGSECKSASRW